MAVTNLTTEEWRTLPGSDGRYEVSTIGRIRALFHQNGSLRADPLVMSAERERCGYLRVHIRYGGTVRHMLVHRLVATVFLGPPPTGRSVCNHLDGIKTNNAPSNLEWTTHKGNSTHAVAAGLYPSGERHGSRTRRDARPRGEGHSHAKLTDASVREIRARHAAGATASALAREYRVSIPVVAGIVHGRGWAHVL